MREEDATRDKSADKGKRRQLLVAGLWKWPKQCGLNVTERGEALEGRPGRCFVCWTGVCVGVSAGDCCCNCFFFEFCFSSLFSFAVEPAGWPSVRRSEAGEFVCQGVGGRELSLTFAGH